MKSRKKSFLKISLIIILVITSLISIGIFAVFMYAKKNIDFSVDESLFESAKNSSVTKIYYDASYGEGGYQPKEFASLMSSENKKIWYSYDEIGDNLKNAFIAVEDQKFFKHSGVDFKRTAFALLNYIFRFKDRFGASTITQQVIKNISGDNQQTLSRKFSEIIRALNIEKTHSKEEIFELYLNIIPMGEGILGVGLASEYYFDKTPDKLTSAEVATLVGITNAPTRYNPIINPEACLEKRNSILRIMHENRLIDSEEYHYSKESALEVQKDESDRININSWFVESMLDDIIRDFSKEKGISTDTARFMLMNGGYSIYSTVNPKVQEKLESCFEDLSNFPASVENGLNYSMVICDTKTGNLLGVVGAVGKKEGNRLLNHALVPHTPGSTLKPLSVYAPAINLKKVHWATVFDDVPVEFYENGDGSYREFPRNSPRKYDGAITLSDALANSKNTVAVRIYKKLSKDKIFKTLYDGFGFDTLVSEMKNENGQILTDMALSPLALGQLTYGVSLRKLTEAYTVFANDGNLKKGRSYLAVYDSAGNIVLNNSQTEKRIYTKETARIMNKLLMGVVEDGTAKSITLNELVDTAGKTGTSGNDKDRLFVGYTPYFTAGIWCGYSKGESSIGAQNISHLKIWDDIMKEIHEMTLNTVEDVESFSTFGLQYLPYCKDSGGLYYDKCMYDIRSSRLAYGFFTEDNKPEQICNKHVLYEYDTKTGSLADENTPEENIIRISLLDIEKRDLPIEIEIEDEKYTIEYFMGDEHGLQTNIFEQTEYSGFGKRRNFGCPCPKGNVGESYRKVS